jgi:3-dehydroquinate dehydratase / shikimate dehydrogenase
VESAETVHVAVEHLRSKAWLILSFHNFSGTPALEPVLKRMTKIAADAYKIVTTARKPSDNYRVLSLARSNPRTPLVMLAMGEPGLATRVLSLAQGAVYTYAAPNAAEGTAPGQISARLLRQIYRVDKISKAAKIYGVIADPVRHSISPAVHNRLFQSRRIDAVYLPFLVKPPQLKDFFALAAKLPIAGFSVTIPHKQKVIRYLDAVDPLARRIGAVNTVWRKAGKWRGTNTDVAGVLVPLKKKLNIAKASVLIVGNGGAARGAAFALSDAGARVSIVGRNLDRARALCKITNATPLTREQAEANGFDALIHCTPLGMYPHPDGCFFKDKIPGEIVFDMVYNPFETTLIKRAAALGKEVVPGLQMFLEQAAQQFEIWTGESAPRSIMEKSALEALTQKH